jgi:imidazolonepropionase
VAWIGRAADMAAVGAGKTWNIGGKVLTPGLVDPHTHIVYGGVRGAVGSGMRWIKEQ